MSNPTTSKSTASTSTQPQRPGTAPATGAKSAAASAQNAPAVAVGTPATGTQTAAGAGTDVPTGAPKAAQGARPGATKPWSDLPANPALQKPSRDKSVPATLIAMTSRLEGATIAEIKAAYVEIGYPAHDPGQGMRWLSQNRGFGFKMPNKENGKIFIVLK